MSMKWQTSKQQGVYRSTALFCIATWTWLAQLNKVHFLKCYIQQSSNFTKSAIGYFAINKCIDFLQVRCVWSTYWSATWTQWQWPRWHPIHNIVHYFWQEPYSPCDISCPSKTALWANSPSHRLEVNPDPSPLREACHNVNLCGDEGSQIWHMVPRGMGAVYSFRELGQLHWPQSWPSVNIIFACICQSHVWLSHSILMR